MKRKAKRNLKSKIIRWDNDGSMPSYITSQCLDLLDAELTECVSKYSRPTGLKWIPSLASPDGLFSQEDTIVYTCQLKDKVIGVLQVEPDLSERSYTCPHYYIHNIIVDPEYRQLGIGKSLIRKLFDDTPKSQYTLTVWCQNKIAQKLYQSVGFCTDLYKIMFCDGTIL